MHAYQRPGGNHVNAGFLPQFPPQRRLDRLPGFQLPAGKFPQAALMYMRRAAADQHPLPVIEYRAGCHMNTFRTIDFQNH